MLIIASHDLEDIAMDKLLDCIQRDGHSSECSSVHSRLDYF